MREDIIVNEFLDARAYVSHTLVKHRLSFALDDASVAREQLKDSSVWPLVGHEIIWLCKASSGIFGIKSEPLTKVNSAILDQAYKLQNLVGRFLDKEIAILPKLRETIQTISSQLSDIYSVLDQFNFDVNEDHIRKSTSLLCDNESLQDQLTNSADKVSLLIKSFFNGTEVRQTYHEFWNISVTAFHLSRVAIVAAALQEEYSGASVSCIRDWQRTLRAAERVASAWSPQVTEEERPAEAKKGLLAGGFASHKELLTALLNTPKGM